jgi:hypothetical protein
MSTTTTFICSIVDSMNIEGDKRYISFNIGVDNSLYVQKIHAKNFKSVRHLIDPLNGTVLRVKVPFRYNRVMCKVTGNKTVQELVKGDRVSVVLKYCGWWESDDYGGPSWKLVSVSQV